MTHSTNRQLVFVAILSYFLIQSLSFSLFKTGADIDTAELLLYIQSWDWGYGGSQPPFFNWVARAVTQIFGVNLPALSILKFLFLALTATFVFLSAERLSLSVQASLLAVLGIFLMPELGWETQRSLTHSIPMLAFCAIGFFCFLEICQTRSIAAYLGYGVALALSVLSKYNGGLFFGALLLAGLSLPRLRPAVLSGRMLISLGLASILMIPHGMWASMHIAQVAQRSDKFELDNSNGFFASRMQGGSSLFEAFISVAGPILILLLFILLYQRLRGRKAALPIDTTSSNLPLRVVLIAMALVIIGVLVSGAGNVLNRWLSPALLLLPLAIAVWLDQKRNVGAQITLVVAGGLCGLLYTVALPASILVADDDSSRRSMLDYEYFWEQVTKLNPPICRVLTDEYAVFGNLRLVDPSLNVADTVFHTEFGDVSDCGVMLAWRGAGDAIPEGFSGVTKANGLDLSTSRIQRIGVNRIDDPSDVTHFYFVVLKQ